MKEVAPGVGKIDIELMEGSRVDGDAGEEEEEDEEEARDASVIFFSCSWEH